MNLVKWFRKNNTKVMAVVVIVLMVGFVGGTALTQLLRGSGGANKAVAYYGAKKHKITYNDRKVAQQELEIIRALGGGQILQYQDLRGVLLGELLFSQDHSSADLMAGLRQHIQQNRYYVSDKQLSAMYTDRTVPTDIYWILLRDEARDAGFHVRSEDIGPMLGKVIPQLYQGATYKQMMQSLVNRYGVPEKDILADFGKLWAVLQYAEAVCDNETVTNAEIRHLASFERQTLTAECVQLKAEYFVDKSMTPTAEEMTAQFEKYKTVAPGAADEQNPYGFGYKLPDRIQIEYIVLDLNDVSTAAKRPTAEEAETYYQDNRDTLYSEEVLSDPNDPNSPRIRKPQSYAEVADTIMDQLTREKIIAKAEEVLLDARSVADAGLEATGSEDRKLTVAQMEEEAGNYDTIAAQLGQKYGVALYSGRTGLLSAADIQADKNLGRLFLTGYGRNPIRLSQILFSAEELGDRAVTLMSMPRAELYRSIGPVQDPSVNQARDLSGQIMGIVRIVAVEPAAAPANLDVEYSTKTLTLGDAASDEADSVYSVKDQVIDDLRKLAAWDTTKAKAQELIEVATKESWDKAVNQFNERYGAQAKSDPNDPNVFEVQHLAGLQKIPSEQMDFIAMQAANSPGAARFLRQLFVEQRFINRLYALIPDQSDVLDKAPLVLEFKPDQSFYCLKSLSIQRVNQQQFEQAKPMLLVRTDRVETQSLAAVHFNPSNILERTKFEFAEKREPETEKQTAENQEDAS